MVSRVDAAYSAAAPGAPLRRSLGPAATIWPLLLLIVLLAPAVCSLARASDIGLVDGLWVMRKVDERYEGDDVQEDLKLTLDYTGAKAGRPQYLDVRWIKKDFGKEDGLVVHFLAPSFARGVTLNMTVKPYQDDDRWLYFPESNLIRRVNASDEHSNFMGTDFTYYDLAEREPEEENHKLLRIEGFLGVTCYVVESTPRAPVGDGYAKKVTWVDKDRFVKLRIDYSNKAGVHRKRYDAKDWRKIDGIWTPMLLTMEDFLSRHVTRIERSNVRYNQNLSADFFSPRFVDCVRYQDGRFSLIPFEQRPTAVYQGKPKPKPKVGDLVPMPSDAPRAK